MDFSTRRNFFKSSASIAVIGASGYQLPSKSIIADTTGWNFEELQPAPENTNWRILSRHDTGFVTEGSRIRLQGSHRIELYDKPDYRPAYGHFVREQHEEVRAAGIDSIVTQADFSKFDRVLLRYHHWIEEYSFLPGKWISLQLGRGWIGKSHPRKASEIYGKDGSCANTMHPGHRDGNGLRLMVAHEGQKSPYGSTYGRSDNIVPKGHWFTVDVVVEKDRGFRLYRDGNQEVETPRLKPVSKWTDCKAIWYRHRLMHGGNSEELLAIKPYREWFGGFFVAVA